MRNIAIITARSGSKGLRDKNIRLLNGKPLIRYSIDAALQSGLFEEVMVSTDSGEYANIARQCGARVPFLRSTQNSGDNADSWDVVLEVLDRYREDSKQFDTVCLLQPTSPLRTADDIAGGYKTLADKKADAVTGVCLCEHPIQYYMELDDSMSLAAFRKDNSDKPRQFYPDYYRINGALYIKKIQYDGNTVQLLDHNEYAYVMDRLKSVDIDTADDFDYAEFLMKKSLNKPY